MTEPAQQPPSNPAYLPGPPAAELPPLLEGPHEYDFAENDDDELTAASAVQRHRRRHNRRRWVLILTVAAGTLAILLWVAAQAIVVINHGSVRITAEPVTTTVTVPTRTITLEQPDNDTAFLLEVNRAGIVDVAFDGRLISYAHTVCAMASPPWNYSRDRIVGEFLAANSGLRPDLGEKFVALAMKYYCP